MIAYVSDIMTTEIHTIDFYAGVCKAERMMDQKDIGCLPVFRDGKLAGVITSKDVRKCHPNRIVADAMTKKVISVTPKTSLWRAKQKLEKYDVERLLVLDDNHLLGLITQSDLYMELGKYVDLLTGLYRSDYIYHQAMELIKLEYNISIIFLDINNFGHIDKKFGHTQGDMILKEIGKVLQKHIPKDTYLCRFGGDEFVILAPFDSDASNRLTTKLLGIVSTHPFYNNISVTASAGIASSNQDIITTQPSLATVAKLINDASLASTKAKKEKLDVIIADGDIGSITA